MNRCVLDRPVDLSRVEASLEDIVRLRGGIASRATDLCEKCRIVYAIGSFPSSTIRRWFIVGIKKMEKKKRSLIALLQGSIAGGSVDEGKHRARNRARL